jgi:hypothetical protein
MPRSAHPVLLQSREANITRSDQFLQKNNDIELQLYFTRMQQENKDPDLKAPAPSVVVDLQL